MKRLSERFFSSLLTSPTGYVLAAFAGLVVTLPALGMGFFLDDYAQLALVEDWYPETTGIFDLYAFLGDLPLDPWWKHPEFKVSMWRPLSSALLQLDNRLFGHDAVGYHAHSILWYLGVVAACGLLFSRILPHRIAVLALLVFALDECHLLTAGWIANRHAMVAMVPSLLGVVAHLRWREDGWQPGLPLSLLGYAVGLLGGEVALGIMVYAVAYEILTPSRPWRERLVGLLPLASVGGSYAIGYKLMGFGASNSGFYLDPVGEPAQFMLGAAENVPVLLGAALFGVTSDLSFFLPDLRPVQVAGGIVAVLVFAALLRSAWKQLADTERGALRWLLAGAVLSLLPVAVAQPFDRVLIGPMVGGAPMIAVLMRAFWRRWRSSPEGRQVRWAALAITIVLAGFHIALPALGRLAGQFVTAHQWEELRRMARQIPAEVSTESSPDVILLNAPDIVIGGFFPLMHSFDGKRPFRTWEILTLDPRDMIVTRSGPRELAFEVLDGELLSSPPEKFHRPTSSQVMAGDVFRGRLFEVEIAEVNEAGPTHLLFRFERELDDPELVFLGWSDKGLMQIEIPAAGEALELKKVPGAIPAALEGLAPLWARQ